MTKPADRGDDPSGKYVIRLQDKDGTHRLSLKKNGEPFRFVDIDAAIKFARQMFFPKWKSGKAKVIPLDSWQEK